MGYTKYTSIESILTMLDGSYSKGDIYDALSSLEAMHDDGNITENQYTSVKALLEDKL